MVRQVLAVGTRGDSEILQDQHLRYSPNSHFGGCGERLYGVQVIQSLQGAFYWVWREECRRSSGWNSQVR